MCLSCGCGEPNGAHGNADNITMDKLEAAAIAGGVTAKEALDNMRVGYLKVEERA